MKLNPTYPLPPNPTIVFADENHEPDFRIDDVFDQLYRGACQKLYNDVIFPSSDEILHHMVLLHRKLRRSKAGSSSVVDLIKRVMDGNKRSWARIGGSTDTCFACLRRRPEYFLPCHHSLCLACVKDFGDPCQQNPTRFIMTTCCLCGRKTSNLVVLDRPPTAGIGLLCLDGGGVRGVVQTEILSLLEQRIGLPIPVQEHFQLAAGASAGGLNLIALFLKGWQPSACTSKYEKMAHLIFRKGVLTRHMPWLSAVLALWTRALYPVDTLEQVFQQTYNADGGEMMMLDPSYASSIGARIILPVARSPEPRVLVFTNYNEEKQAFAAGHASYEVFNNQPGVAVSDV